MIFQLHFSPTNLTHGREDKRGRRRGRRIGNANVSSPKNPYVSLSCEANIFTYFLISLCSLAHLVTSNRASGASGEKSL